MKSNVHLPAAVLVLSLAAFPAFGQESAQARNAGSVTIGAQGGSGIDESSKLQQYEIVHKGVFLPGASFSWNLGSSYTLKLKTSNLGLDDQFAGLTLGKKNGFQLSLAWDQNPNWLSNTARTPYTQTISGSTAAYHLPDGMRLALQNVYAPWIPPTTTNPVGLGTAPANPTRPGFFALEPWVAQSQPIDLRYVRKTGTAALALPVGETLSFNASYSREQRDGNKNTTFYGGPNFEVATPIAFRTHNLRVGGEFADGRWFGSAALSFSKFENDVLYAEVDNPLRLEMANPGNGRNVVNDVAFFRFWLPPDNKAYTLDFSGGVKLPSRHKITASLSTGNMSMETDLLPISTNPNLATSATAPNASFTVTPPYSSVAAEYKTLMGALKLTGDPHAKLGYSLTFRRYELDDKSEHYHFTSSSRGDVGTTYNADGFSREPQGYNYQTLRGEVHVLPATGLRLGLSYGLDDREYDLREYADVEDGVFSATADYSHKWLALHGNFTNLKRHPGDTNEEAIQPSWQGATQTDITERDRQSFSGLLTLTPASTFAMTFSAMKQTNTFSESVTGLLDQSFDQFGVDLTYAPNARVSAYGGYSYERYKTKMAAAYFPRGVPLPPNFDPKTDPNYWENDTDDQVDTFRAGLQWTVKPDKIDVSADLDYTRPRNDSRYMFVPGGVGEANGVWPAAPVPGFPTAELSVPTTFTGFPLVTKNFLIAKLKLDYHLDKDLTASVLWWKQKFDNVDWQTESMMPYMGRIDPGANRWFFLGARVPSYDADIFRVALTYRF